MQDDYDKIRAQFDEEVDTANSLRNQNQKFAADYAQLKSKYEKEVLLKTEENEELKWDSLDSETPTNIRI